MNRKGFAITTVIYGLALLGLMIVTMLMGILSTTRSNISRESERIENILINYNLSSKVFKNSLSLQEFIVPQGETGWYRIEAFGASGKVPSAPPTPPTYTGNTASDQVLKTQYNAALAAYENNAIGEGAYTTGIIYLNEGDKLKMMVGTAGGSITDTTIYYNEENANNKIMVAAGGVNTTPGGTLKTQSAITKGAQINRETSELQTAGDLTGSSGITYGVSGHTSAIRGYPGSSLSNKITDGTKEYYFVDGLMIGATNRGQGQVVIERIKEDEEYYNAQTINNTKTETAAGVTLGKPIERIPRTNKKFNGVTRVEVRSNSGRKISNIYYSVAGNITTHTCNSTTCSFDLPKSNIDDMSIIFQDLNVFIGGVTVYFKVEGESDLQKVYDSTMISKDGKYESGTMSTPVGIKLSAYQPDTTTDITPHGNYYILPVTIEGYAVSAPSTSQDDSSLIGAERLKGETRQRWAIDLINIPNKTEGEPNFKDIRNASGMREYRIIDLARAKALEVYRDENRNNGTVAATQTFNALSRNAPQIWNIRNMSDGTFAIKTVQESLDTSSRSGYLYMNTTHDSDNRNKLIIGAARKPSDPSVIVESDIAMEPTQVERFFLYSLDFATSNE